MNCKILNSTMLAAIAGIAAIALVDAVPDEAAAYACLQLRFMTALLLELY